MELEKFSHSHCPIHDEDKSASGHKLEQLAVWFSGNNLELHDEKKSCKAVGGMRNKSQLPGDEAPNE